MTRSLGRGGGLTGIPALDTFCAIVPSALFARLGKTLGLEAAAARGGTGYHRLGAAGLEWVPTFGNLATLLGFGLLLGLNTHVTGEL